MLKRSIATAVILAALAWTAQAPWGHPADHGLLRLSWRTVGEEIKLPRAQEANLPAHMKLPEADAFDVRIRPYSLRLLVDGETRLQLLVESPGVRHDRPLSVFQEVPVPPGTHEITLIFAPETIAGAAPPKATDPLVKTLHFDPAQVVEISMDTYGTWQIK